MLVARAAEPAPDPTTLGHALGLTTRVPPLARAHVHHVAPQHMTGGSSHLKSQCSCFHV